MPCALGFAGKGFVGRELVGRDFLAETPSAESSTAETSPAEIRLLRHNPPRLERSHTQKHSLWSYLVQEIDRMDFKYLESKVTSKTAVFERGSI